MKEQTVKALKYTGVGLAAVVAAALLTDFLAPSTQIGKWIRFAVPLLTGCIAAVLAHSKIASEIDLSTDSSES